MINITNVVYRKACTEILTILNNMSIDNFKKIPKELIEAFENNKDDNYIFYLDYSKDLKEQNLSDFTIAILNNLYRDYWAPKDKREKIILDENQKRYEKERIKKEKYDPENLFKKPINSNSSSQNNNQSISLIEYEKSFFTKFKNFILRILHINK